LTTTIKTITKNDYINSNGSKFTEKVEENEKEEDSEE